METISRNLVPSQAIGYKKQEYVWRVTYALDSLDPNPELHFFQTEEQAVDWYLTERDDRVDLFYWPFTPKARAEAEEFESQLVKFEKLQLT